MKSHQDCGPWTVDRPNEKRSKRPLKTFQPFYLFTFGSLALQILLRLLLQHIAVGSDGRIAIDVL